jgi:hypothetical protein
MIKRAFPIFFAFFDLDIAGTISHADKDHE